MTISEECWLKAAAIYSHLDDIYKIDEKLAVTKDPKSVVGMARNGMVYFESVWKEETHPGREYYTAKEAEGIHANFAWLRASAETGLGVDLPLRILKDKLFNMAIEKAVECECTKRKS